MPAIVPSPQLGPACTLYACMELFIRRVAVVRTRDIRKETLSGRSSQGSVQHSARPATHQMISAVTAETPSATVNSVIYRAPYASPAHRIGRPRLGWGSKFPTATHSAVASTPSLVRKQGSSSRHG